MLRRVPIALAISLSFVPAAWSQFSSAEFNAAQNDKGLFTLDESSIKIENLGPAAHPDSVKAPKPSLIKTPKPSEGGGTADPISDITDIINLGQKLWKIIADNKPVVDVKVQYATALPKGASGWQDMAGWLPPEGTVYSLSAKNAYGMKVINVRYQVLRTYGGSYNGKGKYLTAVTVEPLNVDVAWGYHFAMEASVPDTSIVNVGTSQNPVAGMMAQLSWRISTVLKDSSGQGLYFLQGDGAFREVAGPFSSPALAKAQASVASAGGISSNF